MIWSVYWIIVIQSTEMRNRTLQIARDEPSMGEIAQSHIGDLLIIREKKKNVRRCEVREREMN